MSRWIILYSLLCIACSDIQIQEEKKFQLEVGDILFQDLDSSPLCDAIELVTKGYENSNLSHIGIVVDIENDVTNTENRLRVLEALPGGVITTSIDSFLMRSFDRNDKPKVIVGRLKREYKKSIPSAIKFIKTKIGMDYDDEFIIDNGKYYCSELIYDAFANDNIFQLQPMTFKHPENGETLKAWINYYSELNKEIPEEKLGINPGGMSLSKYIDIIHQYGTPDGMKR